MALQHLRAFHTAARLGGLTKAAQALNSTQPTISRQIQILEEELGLQLLDHGRRPTKLTNAGQRLLELTHHLFEGIDDLSAESASATFDGTVTLVTTPTRATQFAPAAIARFKRIYPRVKVIVATRHPVEALMMIQEGNADLGLLPDPKLESQFDYFRLYQFHIALIAPRGHPLLGHEPPPPMEEIARYPLIMLRGTHVVHKEVDKVLKRINPRYVPTVEVEGIEAITRLVSLGIGVALAPDLFLTTEADLQKIAVIPLPKVFSSYGGGVVTVKGHTPSPAVQHFTECLTATAAQLE